MNTRKSFSIILPLLLLAACSGEEEADNSSTNNLPLVGVESAKKDTFVHKISVQGTIEADKDILLSAEMGGIITNIRVKEGQEVQKGQVLATIDASVMQSNLAELQTQLSHAEYMLEKQGQLKERGLGTEVEYTGAKTQAEAIQRQINSLQTQKSKSVIRAPFSGIVDKIFGRNGQLASPQSPLLRLVNNNVVDVTANISEKHLANIKVGTPIEVTFPNYKDTTIQLKITNVGNYIEPTNRTFRIMSTISNNTLLLPNMLAEVHITDLVVTDGLIIPSASVLKAQDNSDFIYTANKISDTTHVVQKVGVEFLEKYNGNTLIQKNSSIDENTFIVTEGSRGIVEKDTVRIK